VPGDLDRSLRLGIEQTDWDDSSGKIRVHRSILIEAEDVPGQWKLGA